MKINFFSPHNVYETSFIIINCLLGCFRFQFPFKKVEIKDNKVYPLKWRKLKDVREDSKDWRKSWTDCAYQCLHRAWCVSADLLTEGLSGLCTLLAIWFWLIYAPRGEPREMSLNQEPEEMSKDKADPFAIETGYHRSRIAPVDPRDPRERFVAHRHFERLVKTRKVTVPDLMLVPSRIIYHIH